MDEGGRSTAGRPIISALLMTRARVRNIMAPLSWSSQLAWQAGAAGRPDARGNCVRYRQRKGAQPTALTGTRSASGSTSQHGCARQKLGGIQHCLIAVSDPDRNWGCSGQARWPTGGIPKAGRSADAGEGPRELRPRTPVLAGLLCTTDIIRKAEGLQVQSRQGLDAAMGKLRPLRVPFWRLYGKQTCPRRQPQGLRPGADYRFRQIRVCKESLPDGRMRRV
jgi:hypothetical protein